MQQSIAVIIPAHNDENTIINAISSVLSQEISGLVVHVVDDASSDSTVEIVKRIAITDPRVVLHQVLTNGGPGIARNVGLKAANERFIAFLDADDIWYPEKLKQQLSFMKKKEAALTYTGYDVIDTSGVRIGSFIPPTETSFRSLLKTCVIGTSTVLVDRNKTGDFLMPIIRRAQDYATWLEIAKEPTVFYGIPKILSAYRIVPGSISRNKFKKAWYQWLVYRRYAQLGVFEGGFYMFHYAINGLIKYR